MDSVVGTKRTCQSNIVKMLFSQDLVVEHDVFKVGDMLSGKVSVGTIWLYTKRDGNVVLVAEK